MGHSQIEFSPYKISANLCPFKENDVVWCGGMMSVIGYKNESKTGLLGVHIPFESGWRFGIPEKWDNIELCNKNLKK